MTDPGTTQCVWARILVDELARLGVREVCVSPGSRSTPLVLAVARHPELRARVVLDERSAAFFALGVGRASRIPAAVVTTSGTATANLLPAVVEAWESEVPLLLLTADRPRRLRGADANQTIDQVGLYGSFVRAAHDLPAPSLDPPDILHLRTLAARAVADAVGAPAGPVHLNIPLSKPLEPSRGAAIPDPAEVAPEAYRRSGPEQPLVRIGGRRAAAPPEELADLADRIATASRGVLVCGPVPEPAAVGPEIVALAGACAFPLLADPLSGARWREPDGATLPGSYDLFLGVPAVRASLRPDLVVRVGRAPTSASLQAWLAEHDAVEQIVIDPGHGWKDHGLTASTYLRADPAGALRDLRSRLRSGAPVAGGSGAGGWTERWRRVDDVTRRAVAGSGDFAGGHEGVVLARTVEAMVGGDRLVVGSSMPVRDLDAFGAPDGRSDALLAYGNRGASGIDGTVSTALGIAAGSGRRVVCVLGDVALHHDMNGLLATREEDVEVVFVVVNNDGGGIFHMLPVREREEAFTRFFATPHGLDFRHAAELYGLAYERVDEPSRYPGALSRALEAGGSWLLEVRTDRDENERRHRAVRDAVRSALLDEAEVYAIEDDG